MAYRPGTIPTESLHQARLYWVRDQVLRSLPWPDEPPPASGRWERQSTDTASLVRWQEDTISWLESRCGFRQPQQVKSLLRRFPAVLEALHEACFVLRRHFGLRPLLAAEVVADPESENGDGSDMLFVYIRTALAPDEALAALTRFDEEWFLAQLDRTDGRLNFNLEFL